MYPESLVPRKGNTDWQTFYAAQSTTTSNSWLTWRQPAGCSWIYMFMVGAGGGGGKGAGGAATVGPGGGGSAGSARLLIPAFLVPDVLYIRPGNGGAGATSSGSGTNGTISYIATRPDVNSPSPILTINGGGGGGGAATNTAGSAGATPSVTGFIQAAGLYVATAGANGAAGAASANTAGATASLPSGTFTVGGGGGGNGTGDGGQISAVTGFTPVIFGGVGTTGGNGAEGFNKGRLMTNMPLSAITMPLIFTGGSGGGGHSTGTAGLGGNASYGCGGGGGGNTSGGGGTAGNGGNGGDGFLIIGAF